MKLLAVLSLTILSSQAHAIYLSHCHNFTSSHQAVSYSYESCVNRNFREIEREFDNKVYLSHCMNFGDKVSYSFTSCINRNFRTVEIEMNNLLSHCTNFNDEELSYSFQSCVNRNYREVELDISKDSDN